MKTLSPNWITEKRIDFEYKKYLLLAYLREAEKYFETSKLYPVLGDLVSHYRNLLQLQENKQSLQNLFPERIKSIDQEKMRLSFEKIINDDAIMQEIGQIIEYSIPCFESCLQEGKKIYDFIEGQLVIYAIGIIPLYASEGFFFLANGNSKLTRVYEYQVTIFDNPAGNYRGIHAHYVTSFAKKPWNSYESFKPELIKSFPKFPSPATYVIESKQRVPEAETLIPIAKRSLVKYLASGEGKK